MERHHRARRRVVCALRASALPPDPGLAERDALDRLVRLVAPLVEDLNFFGVVFLADITSSEMGDSGG